ncbi:PAS domain S-box protein [Thermodesulfobacteriota bacterium]
MNERPSKSRSMARQFARDYLIVSLIPLLFLFILVLGGTKITRDYLADLIKKSTYDLNTDAEHNLQKLGEQIIHSKARDVAKQVEIYFRMHHDQGIQEMRNDPSFMALALQKVGKTGYTAIYEAGTWIFRVHPNPNLLDKDVSFLADDLPSWWALVGATHSGDEVSGYYNWLEIDGSIRKKYMTITPIRKKIDGTIMMFAATTYIDEFSAPIVHMKKKADKIVSHYRSYISRQWFIYSLIAAGIVLLTFFGTYFLGRRAAFRYILPIMKLSETAREIGEGKWHFDRDEDVLGRKDEIGVLAQAFSRMSAQLKDLFSRVEQRVTELNRTQVKLKQSEEHYRSLFDGVPVGLYRSSPEGDILDANPAMVQILGYPNRETFIARKAEALYAEPEERDVWQDQMKKSGDVHSYETKLLKYDRTEIWVENSARAVIDDFGKVLYYEGSVKDTTDRRRAETALKKSEEQFRALYEESKKAEELYRSLIHSSADAIVIYDLEGNAIYISPMFTKIFGWTIGELERKLIPFIPESEQESTTATFKDIIEKGIPCQGFETRRTTKDGRLIEVSISASRYDDHEGNPAGMLEILRDISEKKRLEAQFKHIERMEAIGTLAGGIAHDFNNLLMGIQGSISLMRYDMDTSHPHYQDLINIEKQIKRGAGLTGQLLGYARKGKYQIRPLILNDIIKEATEPLKRTRKDITIHYDLAPDLSPIEADLNQIEQVLMNLYINASDAMTEGGDLFLKTRNTTLGEMEGRPYKTKKGDYVMLKVEDTGSGMDQRTMDRIFDPFFTTKDMGRGTGLGLASAYGIIKGHGGYIDVDSKKGRGTKFTIYLPASDKAIVESSDVAKKATKGKGTILIVDDEKYVLDTGTKMLKALGYTVLKAESGAEAIDIYDKNKDRIQMVVLDMVMPDTSGGQAFDRIKEINPKACVLLSSGYSIEGKASEILDRGCDGFIQKPYDIEQLSEKIESIMKENKKS